MKGVKWRKREEARVAGNGRRKTDGWQTPHAYPRPSNGTRSVTH